MTFRNKFKGFIFLTFIFSSSISSAQIDLNAFLHSKEIRAEGRLTASVSAALSVTQELNNSNFSSDVTVAQDECFLAEGNVVLEFDVPCIDIGDSDVVIDLGGFTVSGNIQNFDRGGSVAISNGTVDGGNINLFSRDGDQLIDNITLKNFEGGSGFAVQIESGRIINSTFENNDSVAIDLFFGDSIEVVNNRFINNRLAINIASDNNSVVSNNFFENNEMGIRLYDEDFSGVNDTLIERNVFSENDIGVYVNARSEVNGTVIERNVFLSNRSSGIVFLVDCAPMFTDSCAARDTVVERNVLLRNGFDARSISGSFLGRDFESFPYDVIADDGILILGFEPEQAADGITLTRNFSLLNSALGINADENVIDGGRNLSRLNGDSRQCVGVDC